METVQNSVPLWVVLALTASYALSKIPMDPSMISFVQGVGVGCAVGFGAKYLFNRSV